MIQTNDWLPELITEQANPSCTLVLNAHLLLSRLKQVICHQTTTCVPLFRQLNWQLPFIGHTAPG
jgi:hypothetical protein